MLNWDATKINQTLTCNFEYHSADYDEVWIGDSFSVLIDDPCVSDTITYTVTMSNVDSEFEYTADDSLVEFWVSFSSSIDDASGQNNFCGPITVTLSANSSVDAFLDYNFDLATRNITISVQTESDSDIGFYEN